MDKIDLFFKMAICSLILIFYRGFYLFEGGISAFHSLFGSLPYWLDLFLLKLLDIISILGTFILFYALINFFIEFKNIYIKKL